MTARTPDHLNWKALRRIFRDAGYSPSEAAGEIRLYAGEPNRVPTRVFQIAMMTGARVHAPRYPGEDTRRHLVTVRREDGDIRLGMHWTIEAQTSMAQAAWGLGWLILGPDEDSYVAMPQFEIFSENPLLQKLSEFAAFLLAPPQLITPLIMKNWRPARIAQALSVPEAVIDRVLLARW